jgi:SHS2 domain-containing protein
MHDELNQREACQSFKRGRATKPSSSVLALLLACLIALPLALPSVGAAEEKPFETPAPAAEGVENTPLVEEAEGLVANVDKTEEETAGLQSKLAGASGEDRQILQKQIMDRQTQILMVFGISYSDDIPHAEKVLMEILVGHEKVLKEPQPMVKLHTLGDSSVDFIVRPWINTADYWDVYWDITREVKMRFDREGIAIPFPQRDEHFYMERNAEEQKA